jgi:hypothetical protein
VRSSCRVDEIPDRPPKRGDAAVGMTRRAVIASSAINSRGLQASAMAMMTRLVGGHVQLSVSSNVP